MTTETTTSLSLSRVINADREAVFEAWTQPEHMMNWASPEGAQVVDVQVELRVGGSYRLHMRTGEGAEPIAFGKYLEIDRPRKLVYTWDWEGEMGMGDTTVTVEFNDLGDSTEIVLLHTGFPNSEATNGHDQGWNSCLDRFAALFS